MIKNLIAYLQARFLSLSRRERLLICIPVVLVGIFIIHSFIIRPVAEARERQDRKLEEVEQNIKIIAAMLEKHKRLKTRRQEVEEQYKEIEIKEPGITLLERMIAKYLDLPARSFDIRPSDPQQFGGSYEKTSFIIKFSTRELDKLVSFLDELVNGPAPMIIRRLDLKVSGSNSIEVEIDASSIRKVV